MSIFKGVDRTLNPLTQFYQIALPQGWRENPSLLADSELAYWVEMTDAQNDDSHGHPTLPYEMPILAAIHEWVVLLMDAWADNTDVPRKVFEDFIEAEKSINSFHLQFFLGPEFRYGAHSMKSSVPLSSIPDIETIPSRSLRWVTPSDMVSYARRTLIRMIIYISMHPEELLRCEECNSVFIETRRGQKYCSERCSSRSRVRRFRDREKTRENAPV